MFQYDSRRMFLFVLACGAAVNSHSPDERGVKFHSRIGSWVGILAWTTGVLTFFWPKPMEAARHDPARGALVQFASVIEISFRTARVSNGNYIGTTACIDYLSTVPKMTNARARTPRRQVRASQHSNDSLSLDQRAFRSVLRLRQPRALDGLTFTTTRLP
jgi:hypothetical protein